MTFRVAYLPPPVAGAANDHRGGQNRLLNAASLFSPLNRLKGIDCSESADHVSMFQITRSMLALALHLRNNL